MESSYKVGDVVVVIGKVLAYKTGTGMNMEGVVDSFIQKDDKVYIKVRVAGWWPLLCKTNEIIPLEDYNRMGALLYED